MKELCLDNKVVLRVATPIDLQATLPILMESYSEDTKINKIKIKETVRSLVHNQGILIIEYNKEAVGAVAGYTMPSMFNDDVLFMAMMFYIKKHYRYLTKAVIKEMELALLPTKVNKIVFGFLNTKKQARQIRLMQYLGYEVLETHMVKRI